MVVGAQVRLSWRRAVVTAVLITL